MQYTLHHTRSLRIEPLESRDMLSAVVPTLDNQPQTEQFYAQTALVEPQLNPVKDVNIPADLITGGAEPEVSRIPAKVGDSDNHNEASEIKTDIKTDIHTELMDDSHSARMTLFASGAFYDGNNLLNGRIVTDPIPGIPSGDTGGVAGGNGGDGGNLLIPGFNGVGNVYYLNINSSLPFLIQLYAEFFNNYGQLTQARTQPRPQADHTWDNYGWLGSQLGPSFSWVVTQPVEAPEPPQEVVPLPKDRVPVRIPEEESPGTHHEGETSDEEPTQPRNDEGYYRRDGDQEKQEPMRYEVQKPHSDPQRGTREYLRREMEKDESLTKPEEPYHHFSPEETPQFLKHDPNSGLFPLKKDDGE